MSENTYSYDEIYAQARAAAQELLDENREHFNSVRLLVVGGSSSEIAGGSIGHMSTYVYGKAVASAILDLSAEGGFAPAFQCCEHLNRSLVMERDEAEKRGYNIVCAVPRPKAGGSLATATWKRMQSPVLVEAIQADAGLDVGLTMIGMHLRAVAVPIRLRQNRVGSAIVTAARTRLRLIGGNRAAYTEED